MSDITVTGLKQLGQALQEFGDKVAKKYLRAATSDAAEVFKEDAKNRAPVYSGHDPRRIPGAMRDAIDVFSRNTSDPMTARYAVGVGTIRIPSKVKRVLRTLKRAKLSVNIPGDTFYAKFVERGTSKMAAQPFLRPAFDSQSDAALEQFRLTLSLGVDQAARDAAK
jgi:HK97 gp10 family phage protein